MCGIVGALAFGKLSKKDEEIRQRLMRFFTTELLIQTEDRGKDATGASILFDDTHFMGIKRGDKCSEWLAKFGESADYFGSLLKVWRTYDQPVRIYLGHCRQGTIGEKEENANNHPIKIGNIVGVHNGVIRNHKEIAEHLGCKRDGQVDSEVIFRLFAHYTNNGAEPFTLTMCQEIVDRLDGEFAVMAYNANNLEQVPIFRDRRPVEFVLIKPYGLLLVVSEIKFWNEVYFEYERILFYNPDFMRKMPSLATIGTKKQVEIETLSDDHAVIFDLTKEVTEDTKLKDLYVTKRMERNSKKWTKTLREEEAGSHTATTKAINVMPWQGNRTTTSSSTDSNKKHYVWNKDLGKYVAMVGDKVIDEKSSVVIDVDRKSVDTVNRSVASASSAAAKTNEPDEKKGPEEDKADEQAGPMTPEVMDMTEYDSSKTTTPSAAADKKDNSSIEGQVVEVTMKTPSPDLIEEVKSAFLALPLEEKGYTDSDAVLNDIEVQDEDTALRFGVTLIANRVHSVAWKKGYMARLIKEQGKIISRDASEEKSAEKSAKKEQHIANLKAVILVLAEYANKMMVISGAESTLQWKAVTKKKIADIAAVFNNKIDIQATRALFNQYEAAKVADVFDALENPEKFRNL